MSGSDEVADVKPDGTDLVKWSEDKKMQAARAGNLQDFENYSKMQEHYKVLLGRIKSN